jgi:hypothetical protein
MPKVINTVMGPVCMPLVQSKLETPPSRLFQRQLECAGIQAGTREFLKCGMHIISCKALQEDSPAESS